MTKHALALFLILVLSAPLFAADPEAVMISLVQFLKGRLAQDAAFQGLSAPQRFNALVEAIKLFGIEVPEGPKVDAEMSDAALAKAILAGSTQAQRAEAVRSIGAYLGNEKPAAVPTYYAGAPKPSARPVVALAGPSRDAAVDGVVGRLGAQLDGLMARLRSTEAKLAEARARKEKLLSEKQAVKNVAR